MPEFIPQTISWNLTQLCNLACGHCYLDATARKGHTGGEMDARECRQVVDQIHAVSPEALLILTGGEPLLRPDLFDLCAYASRKGLWVVVGTNGTRLSPASAVRLRDAGVKGIGISIDSLRPEAHNRFRGRPGAWAGAVAGLEAAARSGLDTVVQVSLFPWNLAEVEAMADWALRQGARAVNFYFLVCTGRGQGQTELPPEEAERAYARLYALQEQYHGRLLVNAKCAPQYQRFIHQRDPESPHLHAFQGGCPAATHYCRIDPRGDVTPCPYIPAAGGNLREDSLERIWSSSEPFRALREKHALQGRCGACEYRVLCGGCRARGLAEHGDLLAEDSFCNHLPASPPLAAPILPRGALYFQEPDAEENAPEVTWTEEARGILQNIPPFVRPMVKSRMETYAAKEGIAPITAAMLREIRAKRMPFLRRPVKEEGPNP